MISLKSFLFQKKEGWTIFYFSMLSQECIIWTIGAAITLFPLQNALLAKYSCIAIWLYKQNRFRTKRNFRYKQRHVSNLIYRKYQWIYISKHCIFTFLEMRKAFETLFLNCFATQNKIYDHCIHIILRTKNTLRKCRRKQLP